jgi:hypothetical protein
MGTQDYDDVFLNATTSLSDLEQKRMKLIKTGAPLLFAPALFIIILVLLPREIAEALFVPGLVISMLVALVGAYFGAKSTIWRDYVYSIRILQRLSPPDPTITWDYAVTRYEDTIIFTLRSAPGALYFVSFTTSEQTPAQKIDVPRTFWKWNSVLHVEGLRVHNRKGAFSIPTPDTEILSGAAILLLLPVTGRSYVVRTPEFSRDRLLAVADYASLLTSN